MKNNKPLLIGAILTVCALGFQNCGSSPGDSGSNTALSMGTVVFSENFDGQTVIVPPGDDGYGTYGLLDFWPEVAGSLSISTNAGTDGTKGARLQAAALHLLKSATLDPAKRYRVGADVRLTNYALAEYPYIHFSLGYQTGDTYQALPVLPNNNIEIKNESWKTVQIIIEPVSIPSGAIYKINFELSSKWGTSNILDVDNIIIEEL